MAKKSKTKPDPFDEFEDWLMDGPAGEWTGHWPKDNQLTETQQSIVHDNVKLLLDRKSWTAKVGRFEEAIALLKDDEEKKAKRAEHEIHFDRHVFEDGYKDFGGYYFPCSTNFREVEFGEGDVEFSGVTFGEGLVTFASVKIGKGNVYFIGANMKSAIVFSPNMVIQGNLYVTITHFRIASFYELKVFGTASFEKSKFDEVPDFRDADFDRPPDMTGMVVPPPKMKKERFWHFSLARNKGDAAKYRKLKAMALAAYDHEKDGEFFSYEMMAKRGHETESFGSLLFSTIYWVLSDYGQSFMRPLKAMAASFVGFFVGYLAILLSYLSSTTVWWDALWFSAIHSFQNAVPIFGTFFRFAAKPEGKSGFYAETYPKLTTDNGAFEWLYWGGVIQSIFGVVFLFLFLLALRNKFRLK